MNICLIKTASLFCFLALLSWTFQSSDQINRASWLIGTWENKTTRGSVYETWTKINKYEMFGMSYTVSDMDTLLFEEIQMIQKGDSLYYIPTVSNQNNGKPIRFALSSITDTSMTFKHEFHDFPQIISYTMIEADSLNAAISGIQNGQERRILFPMKRINKK